MIRLIKRQQGLPFLFALGVMFILSASFLAVQLWSDNEEFRGAAAALEAPLIPPDLNAPTIVPPPRETSLPAKKNVVGNKAQKELAEIGEPEEEASVAEKALKSSEEVVEIPQKQAPVKVAKVEKNTAIKLEKPETIKERPVQKPLAPAQKPVTSEPAVEVRQIPEPVVKKTDLDKAMPEKIEAEEHSVEKRADSAAGNHKKAIKERAEPKKTAPVKDLGLAEAPVKKVIAPLAKAVRKTKSVEIPTEVPPEWNWFPAPLRLEMTDGKVEIVSVKTNNHPGRIDDVNSGKFEVKSSPRTPERRKAVSEGRAKVVVASEKAQDKFAEKPFVKALGKMAKLKERRIAAGRSPATKTIPPVVVREATMALMRLQDMVRLIGSRSEQAAVEESEEVVTFSEQISEEDDANSGEYVDVDEIATVEAGSQSVLDSSYRGSGSSFSMRVNELIRSGAWLRD